VKPPARSTTLGRVAEQQTAPEQERPAERTPPATVTREEPGQAKRPPGAGWELGAAGLGKVFWVGLTILLTVIGAVLLLTGYIGYGAMILVLALAAGVNLK
jgi:hypothetical protein